MTLEQQITESLAEGQSLVVQPAWPNRPEGEWMASIRTETRSGISGKGIHGKDREAAIANLHTKLTRDRCFPELTGDEEGFTDGLAPIPTLTPIDTTGLQASLATLERIRQEFAEVSE